MSKQEEVFGSQRLARVIDQAANGYILAKEQGLTTITPDDALEAALRNSHSNRRPKAFPKELLPELDLEAPENQLALHALSIINDLRIAELKSESHTQAA